MFHKVTALVVALVAMFSLTACSVSFNIGTGNDDKSSSTSITVPDFSDDSLSSSTDSVNTGGETNADDVDSSTVTSKSEATTDEPDNTGNQSIGESINAVKTAEYSMENPVPFNTFADLTSYAVADNGNHEIYVRVADVVMESDSSGIVEKAVAEHNSNSSEFSQISLDEIMADTPDDVEWGLMYYEVYIPETFPTTKNGIMSMDVTWSISNKSGGGIPSKDGSTVYIGLGSSLYDLNTDETNRDTVFEVGNTYKFTVLMPMVKGYKDYVFETTYYTAGSEGNVEDLQHGYFSTQ